MQPHRVVHTHTHTQTHIYVERERDKQMEKKMIKNNKFSGFVVVSMGRIYIKYTCEVAQL